MDSSFPHPNSSICSNTICLWGSGKRQIKLRRISSTRSLCKVTAAALLRQLSNATISLHEVDIVDGVGATLIPRALCVLMSGYHHKSIQDDVIWCYFVLANCAFVLTQCIEKDIPFGCCVIGSLPVTQLIWRSLSAMCTCDQSSSERPRWQSDYECQSSLQTGLSSSRQEAGSSRGAALSHLPAALAASPPHHSNRVWWCAQLHAGRLFWFQPVWHICCLSCCVAPVCELSATGANVFLIPLSVFTGTRASKQASMVHVVREVRRPDGETTWTCAAAVTSLISCCKCEVCGLSNVSALY